MTRSPAIVVALVAALASCSDAGPLLLRNHDNSPMSEQTKGADTVTNTIDSTTAKTTTVNQESEGQYFDEKNFTSTLDELINSNGTVREEEEEVEDDDDDAAGTSDGDGTLSAIWYLAAFGGLVLFFFVVTCSELFLDNPVHARRQMDLPHAGYLRRHYLQRHTVGGHFGPETPPPPYHLFAPPSYDDFVKSGLQEKPPRCDKHRAAAAEEKPMTPAKEKPMTPAADPVYILPLHHVPTMMFQPPFRSHMTPPLVVAEMTKQLNAAWQQNGKPRATDDE